MIKDYPKDNPGYYGLWYDLIEEHFYPSNVDDVTDIDNEKVLCYQYLISLNKKNESLSDESIDGLIKTDNAYFLEIMISREKPLTSVHFWRYSPSNDGAALDISEKAFLPEHKGNFDKFLVFTEKHGLIVLDDAGLEGKTIYNGETVSIYYKYFDQTLDDPLKTHYSNQRVQE